MAKPLPLSEIKELQDNQKTYNKRLNELEKLMMLNLQQSVNNSKRSDETMKQLDKIDHSVKEISSILKGR